jgi:hypothetical protein
LVLFGLFSSCDNCFEPFFHVKLYFLFSMQRFVFKYLKFVVKSHIFTLKVCPNWTIFHYFSLGRLLSTYSALPWETGCVFIVFMRRRSLSVFSVLVFLWGLALRVLLVHFLSILWSRVLIAKFTVFLNWRSLLLFLVLSHECWAYFCSWLGLKFVYFSIFHWVVHLSKFSQQFTALSLLACLFVRLPTKFLQLVGIYRDRRPINRDWYSHCWWRITGSVLLWERASFLNVIGSIFLDRIWRNVGILCRGFEFFAFGKSILYEMNSIIGMIKSIF